MPKEDIHWHDRGKRFDKDTGDTHVFKVRTYFAYVLDVEDIHFHFDSAVLLPDQGPFENVSREDERVTGLAVLRSCLKWAKDYPADKLLIAGHTDRSGPEDYNLKLSRLRAKNAFYMLTGVREAWVEICKKKHQVEDYQQILKWIHMIWGWDCDPGPIDNIQGPKTKKGTENFQAKYKAQDWGEDILVDGIVGSQTWGAFYRVYERVLMFLCEVDEDGLKELRNGLHYLSDDKKWVGCGEYHPVTPDRTVSNPQEKRAYERNVTDRRVELMFFRDDIANGFYLPPLDCHPSETECKPKICWVYNTRAYRFLPIIPEPIPPLQETWVVRVLQAGTGKIDERTPLKNTPYEVTGSGAPAEPVKGTTDGSGILRIRVYAERCEMTLRIAGGTFKLRGGELEETETGDPASDDRLYNMGYGSKDPDGWSADDRRAAVKQFQEVHEVGDKQGTLDGPTKGKVKELYGS